MSFSSVVRQPRISVQVDGQRLAGAFRASVSTTGHYAADRFSVEVALGADPVHDASFWASATSLIVDVAFSLDGGATWASLAQGSLDQADIDILRRTVRLEGRDLTSSLIEARTQETFSNRTSSEIATLLAARHGLTADVTPTTTLVGRYYSAEHDSITLDQFSRQTTEWDLLVFLARQEQFDVYVRQTTLSFHPPTTGTAAVVLRPADLIALRAERSLTLAGDIEVTVKSWNARQKRAFTQTARSAAGAGAAPSGSPRSYVYVVPNLTTSQAISQAQQKLAELTRHERVVSLTMPGELTLTARDVILLQGTSTAFDQAYYVDSIDRHVSADGGFVQHVRAVNVVSNNPSTPPGDLVASVTG